MPYRPPPSENSDSDVEHSRYVSNPERAVSKHAMEDARRAPKSMAQCKGKKKDKTIHDDQDIYKSAARWISRGITLYNDLHDVFRVEFLLMIFAQKDQKKLYLKIFKQVLDLVPGFSVKVESEGNKDSFLALFDMMIKSSSNARTVDTTHMKKFVAQYAPLDLVTQPLKPALVLANKCDRGFSHPMLARLLCPNKYLPSFDEDFTSTWNKLKNNEIKVLAKHWPAFVYKDYQYDPSDREKGLFRGHLLICAWRAIYIGPSAARLGPDSKIACTKSGNAKLHGANVVTPRTIAYAACQARFAISSIEMWSPDDGTFNYPIFYRRIVELFERYQADKWTKDTLAWWNKTVFGDESGHAMPNSGGESDTDGSDSEWEALHTLRCERCAIEEEKSAQAASLDTGARISAAPLLGAALEASNPTPAALNMLATTASRMNAPGADDTDHTITTGSSSLPPLRQLAIQSSRHGQSNRRMLWHILDEDEDEDEDMYLDSRPRGSSSNSCMHDGEDGTTRQSRKRKTLVDDDSDTANNDTGSVAHRSRNPRRLVEGDDEHEHDNHDDDNHDDMAPQLRKRTASHAQYDDDSSRTSKARKAKMNAGATSTSKGKGRS
ncbi:hypothetical protein HETIRDRAFT_448800 [Heterobasidion irregulare TC 32-1]|uniref:Uncharacterized protein n=1 Tax=Heterobasidion irregulare (strain TC 32-1) TaxID=747525 RepID=W4KIZ4_HETIT|nr:uncharacterized protein HETIRDRAFT_448800 [Heterobasidion irregulare TC 32-1]ETW85813.1 hypothetical protein HETIRDRAFT_448800 [Heterobasidion irregulare TC 32-1]